MVQVSCITDFPLKMFAAETNFPAVFAHDSIFSLSSTAARRAHRAVFFQAFMCYIHEFKRGSTQEFIHKELRVYSRTHILFSFAMLLPLAMRVYGRLPLPLTCHVHGCGGPGGALACRLPSRHCTMVLSCDVRTPHRSRTESRDSSSSSRIPAP